VSQRDSVPKDECFSMTVLYKISVLQRQCS